MYWRESKSMVCGHFMTIFGRVAIRAEAETRGGPLEIQVSRFKNPTL